MRSRSNWYLKCWFLREGKTGEPGEKLSEQRRANNKLNPHIWWRRRRIRTQATLVGGECSHHCATLAPKKKLATTCGCHQMRRRAVSFVSRWPPTNLTTILSAATKRRVIYLVRRGCRLADKQSFPALQVTCTRAFSRPGYLGHLTTFVLHVLDSMYLVRLMKIRRLNQAEVVYFNCSKALFCLFVYFFFSIVNCLSSISLTWLVFFLRGVRFLWDGQLWKQLSIVSSHRQVMFGAMEFFCGK